jgi:hypothetical protein
MGSGTSHESYLRVRNDTNKTFTTSVRDIDSYDWDGNGRPDHNFHRVRIGPNEEVVRREEVNARATASMFTMDMNFDDNTRITVRADQGVASGRYSGYNSVTPTSKEAIYAEAARAIVECIVMSQWHGERGKFGVYGDTHLYDVKSYVDNNEKTLIITVFNK